MKAVDPFYDTNVVLYLLSSDPAKADRAEALLTGRGPDLGSSPERIRCGRRAQAWSVLGRDW